MRKAIKSAVIFTLALSLLSPYAMAFDETDISDLPSVGEIGVEFTPVEGKIKPADSELLSAKNADELAEISRQRFESDESNFSEDKMNYAKQIWESVVDIMEIAPLSDDEVPIGDQELVAFFCLNDGMSITEVIKAKNIGDSALSDATNKYPSESSAAGLRDSYRHFTWNHRMTDQISKTKARIVGCNYEWAAVLEKYAKNAYTDYLNQGYSTTTAAFKACSYACTMREDFYSVCAASKSSFTGIFDNAAIRDFYNNCYGRAYADKYSYTYSTAFTVAINNNELINSDSSVSSSHINSVWSGDWYTAA